MLVVRVAKASELYVCDKCKADPSWAPYCYKVVCCNGREEQQI